MGFDINVLKKICPASESYGEKAAYSTDSSTIKGGLLAVAWPSTYDHLKMLLKYASREEIPIVPRGGGTSLVGGAVPRNAIVADLSRLNKIKKLYLNEKAVVVQAGVNWDKLDNALAEYNLEFPVRPSSHAACTLGGMLATDAVGWQLNDEGFVKSWVKDVTFFDGSGRIFTLDRNEAKRFIGTEGCCGVIIEATLLLKERKGSSTDLFKFSEFSSLMEKIKELKEDTAVIAMEYLNKKASSLVGLGNQEHLLVKYNLPKKGSIEPAEAEELWHKYENVYSILINAGFPRVEDARFERDAEKFVDWVNKQELPCYGGIVSGHIHPALSNVSYVERMAKVVAELKGQMAGAFGAGLLRRKYAHFGDVHNIRELKAKYDAKNIMNKGKVI